MAKDNTCPICGCEIEGVPAISRRDNKSEICSKCGVEEALSDYFNYDNKGEK